MRSGLHISSQLPGSDPPGASSTRLSRLAGPRGENTHSGREREQRLRGGPCRTLSEKGDRYEISSRAYFEGKDVKTKGNILTVIYSYVYIILLIIIGLKILNYSNPYFRCIITVDATSSTSHLIEAMINARRWIPSPLAISNSHLQDSRVRAIIDRLRTGRFTRAHIYWSSVRLSTSPSGSRYSPLVA